MRKRYSLILWTWMALLSTNTYCTESPTKKPGFYERKAEGWFWYQERPVEPEPKETSTTVASTNSPPAATVPAFSAAWFRENLPRYRDAAWDDPSIENVRAFLYLQRYAIDRSQEFSDTTELAVVGDWFLDEAARRPEAAFAAQQVDNQAGVAKQQLVKALSKKFGLFFFFSSGCPHSQLQADILQVLERRTGFTILPISLDGGALPDGMFTNFKIDSGHAQQLGVQSAPALLLASPQGEFSPVGYGAMSLPELEHRLLIAARRKNWLSTEQFNRTRPILNPHNSLSPNQSLQPISNTVTPLPIPPAELVQLLRSEAHP